MVASQQMPEFEDGGNLMRSVGSCGNQGPEARVHGSLWKLEDDAWILRFPIGWWVIESLS